MMLLKKFVITLAVLSSAIMGFTGCRGDSENDVIPSRARMKEFDKTHGLKIKFPEINLTTSVDDKDGGQPGDLEMQGDFFEKSSKINLKGLYEFISVDHRPGLSEDGSTPALKSKVKMTASFSDEVKKSLAKVSPGEYINFGCSQKALRGATGGRTEKKVLSKDYKTVEESGALVIKAEVIYICGMSQLNLFRQMVVRVIANEIYFEEAEVSHVGGFHVFSIWANEMHFAGDNKIVVSGTEHSVLGSLLSGTELSLASDQTTWETDAELEIQSIGYSKK